MTNKVRDNYRTIPFYLYCNKSSGHGYNVVMNSLDTNTVVPDVEVVATSKTSGWISLRYAPRPPRFITDLDTTSDDEWCDGIWEV